METLFWENNDINNFNIFMRDLSVSVSKNLKHMIEDLDKNDTLFLNMVNRRAAGEPLSHIIKSRSFWKNEFYIEETVLDPRPETELIVEITKNSLYGDMKVLDLGCGSGCIGLSLYNEKPDIKLFLSDSSDKALNVAK